MEERDVLICNGEEIEVIILEKSAEGLVVQIDDEKAGPENGKTLVLKKLV